LDWSDRAEQVQRRRVAQPELAAVVQAENHGPHSPHSCHTRYDVGRHNHRGQKAKQRGQQLTKAVARDGRT